MEDDDNVSVEEERPNAYKWWHKKLADFFENVTNVDRLVEVSKKKKSKNSWNIKFELVLFVKYSLCFIGKYDFLTAVYQTAEF